MRSELPRLGHEVTVCPDGRTAVKTLEKQSFDAAILDLRMPGMTGIEVLEHLKKVSPDTEAIVMTGHASMETAIEAIRLGASDYITKPCKLAEIEAASDGPGHGSVFTVRLRVHPPEGAREAA